MNWFSRPPNRPYRNLFFAAFIGVPAGYFVNALLISLVASVSLSDAVSVVTSALLFSLWGYVVMVLALLVYGLPALWLALKLRLAGPATAFAIALLPGLYRLVKDWPYSILLFTPLAVCVATGLAFVALAYRGPTQPRLLRNGRVNSQTTTCMDAQVVRPQDAEEHHSR